MKDDTRSDSLKVEFYTTSLTLEMSYMYTFKTQLHLFHNLTDIIRNASSFFKSIYSIFAI